MIPQLTFTEHGTDPFSFTGKRRKELGIFPGVIHVMATESGLMAPIDTGAIRKGVERLLRKARPSFIRPASLTQANLLVMQARNILLADKQMPDVRYGTEQFGVHKTTGKVECFRAPNGVFRPGQFSNICGLILVHPEVWCFSERFRGDYFPHPSYLRYIQYHPKPFEDMMFTILPEWRGDPHTAVKQTGG